MQAAVEAALSNWALSDPASILSYPRDANGRNLSRYLLSSGSGSLATVPNSVGWWMPRLNEAILSLSAATNVVDMTWTNTLSDGVGLLDDLKDGNDYGNQLLMSLYEGQITDRDFLEGIYYSSGSMSMALGALDFRTDVHGSELLVAVPDLEDAAAGIQPALDSIEAASAGIQDVLYSIESNTYSTKENTESSSDALAEIRSSVEELESFVVSSGTETIPDTPDLESGDDELEGLDVTAPDAEWAEDVTYSFGMSGGSPIISLWSGVRFGSHVIPDGEIDLSEGVAARAVAVMGRISRTLYWLAYYTGLLLLLRREYVYYTSLGSTEGAA